MSGQSNISESQINFTMSVPNFTKSYLNSSESLLNFTELPFNFSESQTNVTESLFYDDEAHESNDEEKTWMFGAPLLLVFGTISNILVIAVLMRKKFRQSSWGLYLTILAICDTLLLYMFSLDSWLQIVFKVWMSDETVAGCKVFRFVSYFLVHFVAWILVAVSCERIVFIYFPMKARIVCRRRTACIVLGTIAFILTGVNAHIFWTFSLTEYDGFYYCDLVDNIAEVMGPQFVIIFLWLDLSIASLVPFVLMIICNITIITKLIQSDRQRQVATSDSAQKSSTTSIAIMLVSTSTMFLMLTLPVAICMVLSLNDEFTSTGNNMANLKFAKGIAEFVQQINSVLNFWLYCLTGKAFRTELKTMLCCGRFSRTPGISNAYVTRSTSATTAMEQKPTTMDMKANGQNPTVEKGQDDSKL
ncbi:unnamed protein product [Owenia fusiformis]|uniref:Uncharacterized protein n=1 Tax=Owenia fusiformis TaxID=6347 RepID=A0A8J1TJN1_OWEFU|nr:unnamed protein product [Owenia fusiformis]